MSAISAEDITSLKESVETEIRRIDHKISYITKLKDQAVENLIKQKHECQEKELLGEIDEEIGQLNTRHAALLKRQSMIHSLEKESQSLEATLAEINNELMAIQERHETVMQQLHEKRDFLQERLGSIEKMDAMKVKISEDFEAEEEQYADEIDRLQKLREELLNRTDLSPSQMELALRDIDEEIEQLEAGHIAKMAELTKASDVLKAEFSKSFSTERKDDILQELEKLKQQAVTATPSELLIIEARMIELKKELGQLETLSDLQEGRKSEMLNAALAERGLKMTPSGRLLTASGRILTLQEAEELGLLEGMDEDLAALNEQGQLSALLEQRGLTLTPSGRIQCENGEVFTMEEARKLGLLQGLEEELMKMRGISLTASGRILTKDGKVLTREEAQHLGLLDGLNLDDMFAIESETESTTESTATSMSGMSSADVHYLKSVLGKPLALGLAEITAKQPRDPIHYLGHWLYKYRYNQEMDEIKKKEVEELLEERERVAREALRQQAEADVKQVLLELIGQIDEEAARYRLEQEKKNQDDTEGDTFDEEEAELESEARDTLGVYGGPTRGQQLI